MKKGFTLIELLAVIVILAVISLIAVPAVLKTIEDSKVSAAASSAKNIIAAAELYYMSNQMNKNDIDNIDLNKVLLSYDGEKATKGLISYDSEGRAYGKMYISGYCIEVSVDGKTNSLKVDADDCDIGIAPPVIEDNPVLADGMAGFSVENILVGNSNIKVYISNPKRYSSTLVSKAVERFNNDDEIVTFEELLNDLNKSTTNLVTTTGVKVNVEDYEALIPIYDIAIKEGNTLSFTHDKNITLTLQCEVAKGAEINNLLVMLINPNTEEVSLIELTEYDGEYGYITLDLPSLGLVTVLYKDIEG